MLNIRREVDKSLQTLDFYMQKHAKTSKFQASMGLIRVYSYMMIEL